MRMLVLLAFCAAGCSQPMLAPDVAPCDAHAVSIDAMDSSDAIAAADMSDIPDVAGEPDIAVDMPSEVTTIVVETACTTWVSPRMGEVGAVYAIHGADFLYNGIVAVQLPNASATVVTPGPYPGFAWQLDVMVDIAGHYEVTSTQLAPNGGVDCESHTSFDVL